MWLREGPLSIVAVGVDASCRDEGKSGGLRVSIEIMSGLGVSPSPIVLSLGFIPKPNGIRLLLGGSSFSSNYPLF